MRSWRSLCSALLLSLALSFAFAALSPTEAHAEWIEVSQATSAYTSATMPESFKVTPIYTSDTAATNIISINTANVDIWWTSHVGGSAPYLIRIVNLASGALAEGNRIQFGNLGNVTCYYNTQSTSSGYSSAIMGATEYRYFVSKSGNEELTEIFPNENGVFVMPYTAQYVFVTCRMQLTSAVTGASFWNVRSYVSVRTERPEDQNEVAAINDQTQVLTDTTGSDTVTGDTTTQYTQQIENLSLMQGLEGIQEQLHEALTTTESDTSVVFPGVNLMGFTMPSYEIDPLAVSPIPPDTIRGFITFIFVCWYIVYMRNLVSNIFNLRWYNYDGEIYDEGTRNGWDYADNNWGLVE